MGRWDLLEQTYTNRENLWSIWIALLNGRATKLFIEQIEIQSVNEKDFENNYKKLSSSSLITTVMFRYFL